MVEPPSAPTPAQQPTQTAPVGDPMWRGIVVALCILLAGLLTTPAAIAYWGQRTLNDSARYVKTVGPLVNSAKVQAAVATRVTDAIEQQVDVEAILNEAFAGIITERPRLESLVGPLAGAINGLIESQVRSFLASDEFADFWLAANARLQQGLIRALKGDTTGAISLQGDQVVLDVSDVIDQVKERLVARGLTMVENLPIPDKDREIVLFDAAQLNQARNLYALFNPLAKWLLAAVGVTYLAAVVISRRRPRTTVIIGAVLVTNALLVAFAVAVGRQMFINAMADTEFAAATRVIYSTLLAYLVRGQQVLLWLGLILMVAGCYLGRNAVGTAVRTTICGGLEGIGAALTDGPVAHAVAGPGRWIAANVKWLRVLVGVLGAIILAWGNQVSESQLFWATFVVVVLLAIMQVFVGVGKASRDVVTPADASPQPG